MFLGRTLTDPIASEKAATSKTSSVDRLGICVCGGYEEGDEVGGSGEPVYLRTGREWVEWKGGLVRIGKMSDRWTRSRILSM